MKTRAAVLVSIKQPLQIMELELPVLRTGQVLVQMTYSGVCRTQLNEIGGLKGEDSYLPHTLGHEGSGIVLEVGAGVTKVRPGQHVVLSWLKGSGIEAGACQYDSLQGRVNSGPISTFLTHAVVSENRVFPIPKELSLRQAALLGCAIPTGAGIVLNQLKLRAGQSVAVFGAGGVGLCAILAAAFQKASLICAIDIHEQKLKQALELGATHVINAQNLDALEALNGMTGNKGFDAVVECAGFQSTMETAFQVTAVGGSCVLAGNLPVRHHISIDPFDLIRGKKLMGSWGGSSNLEQDMPRYLELCQSLSTQLENLITHEVKLHGINYLFDELASGKVGRGLISFAAENKLGEIFF